MPMEIEITKKQPGEPDELQFKQVFDRITDLVHAEFIELDAMAVANGLCSVAANILVESGMTHADVADLLEALAGLSRLADRETAQ